MAGIGFELKKLYKNKGLLAKVRAYLYSIFVTIGPIVISVIVITFLQFLLKYIGVERYRREILQATIMYSFIFAVIISSGYCMMLSRYLSDKLYMERKEDILPALYGSIAFILIVSAIIGFIFYLRSPLDTVYKFFAYMLFVELVIEMVLSVYISAVDNFKRVAYSFLYGTFAAVIMGYVLTKYTTLDEILSVLIAFDICILIVIILLALEVQQYFREKSTLYFNYIKYFNKYRLIFFTNVFYTLGLYMHNFVFWSLTQVNHIVESTYVYAPSYDIPAFYAFLSIMPTMVIFVVKVETAFYEKYRNYFYLVNNGACYEDLEVAKKEMIKIIYRELIYIMEIQLFFSIGFIILGIKLLPFVGFTANMIDMFNILILGYYCTIIMFVVMTILLYYDNKKDACLVAAHFMITSALFTIVTVYLGEVYYGLGFFMSGLLSLIYSIVMLRRYLKNIEYYVFCIQVSWEEKDEGLLTGLIDRINKIGG
ncbi:exopolysaccharide Pel transporter PelG [Wukongibacter baidiensis]|uniref:exopolysaccharide Pel transporter PelG n=1 Tax=Wukongibacter baidiensis TaxID=1723361 RepID=UPI003D7F6B0B